jgi:hypothetical protein
MKNIEEIINQHPVFLHNFQSAFDVVKEFENVYMSEDEYVAEKCPHRNPEYWEEQKEQMKTAIDAHKGENILFASYGTDNYSGDAWVMFEKDGRLYEVSASHCSCYGCEGQWEPTEIVLSELQNRLSVENDYFGKDSYSDNEFAKELINFLGITT